MAAELLFLAALAVAIGAAAFFALWGLWLGASHFWERWEKRNVGKKWEPKA